MIIIGLDISSKTGYCVADLDKKSNLLKRIDSGTLPKTSLPDEPYPKSYLTWATINASQIIYKIEESKAKIIVIEETSKGSKNAMSQKILEFTHFLVASYLVEKNLEVHYLLTGEWRVLTGCVMTNEEKKRNKKVRTSHNIGIKVVKDEKGKRIGKITKKHVNIRRANEIWGLDLTKKNEDEADALLLVSAYLKKIMPKKEVTYVVE